MNLITAELIGNIIKGTDFNWNNYFYVVLILKSFWYMYTFNLISNNLMLILFKILMYN